MLGFTKTEEVRYRGQRCVFLRNGTEHHSLKLVPKALREGLGLSADSNCMSVGMEVGSYRQLRDAASYMKNRGVRFIDTVPPELSLGIDYSAHILDPEGHALQLYCYMEQIGWDGKPRPASLRRTVRTEMARKQSSRSRTPMPIRPSWGRWVSALRRGASPPACRRRRCIDAAAA